MSSPFLKVLCLFVSFSHIIIDCEIETVTDNSTKTFPVMDTFISDHTTQKSFQMNIFSGENTTINSSVLSLFTHGTQSPLVHSNTNSLQNSEKNDWCSWLADFRPILTYYVKDEDVNSTKNTDTLNVLKELRGTILDRLPINQENGDFIPTNEHNGTFFINESFSITNNTFSPEDSNSSLWRNRLEGQVELCISFQTNLTMKVSYLALSLIFCFIILIGNSTILILSFYEKSFRSPVFITLQSLSVVSLFHATELLLYNWVHCSKDSQLFHFVALSTFHWYCQHIFNLHLSVLASQRIFMTIAPLKALIYHKKKYIRRILVLIYLTCALFEVIMAFMGERNLIIILDPLQLITLRTDFVIINSITITLLVSAMMISAIQKLNSSKLQSVGQKRQSRLASVVIVLFLSTYSPLVIMSSFLSSSCQQEAFRIIVNLTENILRFLILSINPIILCLRSKEARTKLAQMFCKCVTKE